MNTIKLRQRIGDDGILHLDIPTDIKNQDMEIVVVLQAIQQKEVDAMGYPIGYFDETYGSLADTPIERESQPPMDIRDEFE